MRSQLAKAGLLERLRSYFSPEEVGVVLETTVLPDGKVKVCPVFLVTGMEIPADLLKRSGKQSLLGRRVVLPKSVLSLLAQTEGKLQLLSKRRAHRALADWNGQGIRVNRSGTEVPIQFQPATIDIDAALNPDDTLTVSYELTDRHGVVLPMPDPATLREDDGWLEVNDKIFSVPVSPPELDLVLKGSPPVQISGDDVPVTLKVLNEVPMGIEVERNAAAARQVVYEPEPTYSAKIDGNDQSVSIGTTLVFKGKDNRRHEELVESATEFVSSQSRGAGRKYKRVQEGWVPLTESTVLHAQQRVQELEAGLGTLRDVRGAAIPELLKRVADIQSSSPWNFYVSPSVQRGHKLLETESKVRFRLGNQERPHQSLGYRTPAAIYLARG